MTVSTEQVRVTYTGTGFVNQFPVPFPVLAAVDLVVIVRQAGESTTLQLGTEYTVTGTGLATALVTTTVAPADGAEVIISRQMALLQPTDYRNQGRFFPETHERSFDRATLQIQQLADGLSRTLQSPIDQPLVWDAQGRRIINVGDPVSGADATNRAWVEGFVSSNVGAIGGFRVPLAWSFVADAGQQQFEIPGAEITTASAYHVTFDGVMQVPGADYEILIDDGGPRMRVPQGVADGTLVLVRGMGYASPMQASEWDAEGNRIRNVGAPILGTDATTRAWVEALAGGLSPVGHTHDAAAIVSGVLNPDRLASGTRDGSRFLRDDGTWQQPAPTPLPLTNRGDLLAHDGLNPAVLAVGSNGQVLIADNTQPKGLRWGSAGISTAAATALILSLRSPSSTIEWEGSTLLQPTVTDGGIVAAKLADSAVTTAKINDAAVTTGKLADGSVTAAKLAALSISLSQIAATGTPGDGNFLRGDGVWADSTTGNWTVGGTLTANIDGSSIVTGLVDPERLGSGWSGIPGGDLDTYLLNAAGDWVQLEALYDGSVVPVGSAFGSPGGGVTPSVVRSIVADFIEDSATIGWTWDQGADTLTGIVKPGSIGLAQVDTASLDTRYALAGSGLLPSGGLPSEFLRGDGVWSNILPSATAGGFLQLRAGTAGESAGLVVRTQSSGALAPRAGVFRIENAVGDTILSISGNQRAASQGGTPQLARVFAGPAMDIETQAGELRVRSLGEGHALRLDALAGQVRLFARDGVLINSAVNVQAAVTADRFVATTLLSDIRIAASAVVDGIFPRERLGSGAPSTTTWLRGDGTWQQLPQSTAITTQNTASIELDVTGGVLSGSVRTEGVTSGMIAQNAVTDAKIAPNAVTTSAIAAGAVTAAKIASGAVGAAAIAANAVGTGQLASGAVTNDRLAAGSITPRKFARPPSFGNPPLTPGLVPVVSSADGGWDFVPLPTGGGGGVPAWQSGQAVNVGDLRTFGGATYRVLQAHTTEVGLEPPNAPSLWAVEAGGSGYITAVGPTSSVNLSVSAGTLTADVAALGIDNSRLGTAAVTSDKLAAAPGAPGQVLALGSGGSLQWSTVSGGGPVPPAPDTQIGWFNVRAYGAVGDGVADDTSAIQAAINAANPVGGTVYLPAGRYRVTSQISINNASDTQAQFKASLVGDSPSTVRIIAGTGNFTVLSVTGGTGAGVHSHQTLRGFFIEKADNQGVLLRIDNAAFLAVENVAMQGGEFGVHGTDVLSSTFTSLNIRFASRGVFLQHENFSRPNAITMTGCVIANCLNYGIRVVGGSTFSMVGGTIEGCGIGGSDGVRYGARFENAGVEGAVSAALHGVYFEHNSGQADLWFQSSSLSTAAAVTGCSFARISSSTFVTNSVFVEASGGARLAVSVAGCGFKGFNDYVPDVGRKYIATSATSGGQPTVSWSGSLFEASVEAPSIPNGIGSSAASTSEWINVRDYGASGDGVTPDDGAFSAAIAVAQGSGKPLWIPAGVYPVTNITIPSGMVVQGAGRDLTVILRASGSAGSDDGTLRIQGNRVSVSNLTVDGNAGNIAPSALPDGIGNRRMGIRVAQPSSNVVVSEVNVRNTRGIGIGIAALGSGSVTDVTIRDCEVREVRERQGIWTEAAFGDTRRINIIGCTITRIDWDGIQFSAMESLLKDCHFYECGLDVVSIGTWGACGIYAVDRRPFDQITTRDLVISGCTVMNCTESGIDAIGRNVVIDSCVVGENFGGGIRATGWDFVINGNVVYNNGRIRVSGPSNGDPFDWTDPENSAFPLPDFHAGIGLHGAVNFIISNNRCFDSRATVGDKTQTWGIATRRAIGDFDAIGQSNNVRIVGNLLTGNRTAETGLFYIGTNDII